MRPAPLILGALLLLGHLAANAQDATPVTRDATPVTRAAGSVIKVDNPPTLLSQQAKHYVILVSLDGFRYDYAAKYGAPHLSQMALAGASTPTGMLPSYPSVTFPNHYTLVTGLRPEHHGIVAMEFYDPDRKARYYYADSKFNGDGTWYSGTPLWVLAEQQGMRSACFFWPGSEAEIQDVRPSYYLHFDDKYDDEKRIAQVTDWLKLPAAERPHFITLYYSNVDHAGHSFGPDAPETRDAVHHLDAIIGKLRTEIKATGLPIDLIVTADHGMIKTDPTPVILDKLTNLDHFKNEGSLLYGETEADAQKAYDELKAHPDPRFTVYRRLEMPTGLTYDMSAREGDPVVVPNAPYYVSVHPPTKKLNAGGHGFDPHKTPEMKAIFYAEGPDIRPGTRLPSFDNIDVYPFVATLLGLKMPPIDGELAPLAPALRARRVIRPRHRVRR